MHAVRYTPELKELWNAFVDNSTNATFLHRREYMDYHADRFTDASIIVNDDNGRTVALFPANAEGTTVCSHRGLTYGGLLVGQRHYGTADHLEAWEAILASLRESGFTKLVYKPVPYIYCGCPSDDDLYALFRSGAQLLWCQPSSAVALDMPLLLNNGARGKLQLARRSGLTVAEDADGTAEFHRLLEDVLAARHNALPVHSLSELQLLMGRFPQNIRLITARNQNGRLMGGILMYFTRHTAHSQYIAISDEGRRCGALAALFIHIIDNECRGLRYFDFGTSCEDAGRVLNASLNFQKYGMGGRPAAYTAWQLDL